MKPKNLLSKHLKLHIPEGQYRSEKQLVQLRRDAALDAIQEALDYKVESQSIH